MGPQAGASGAGLIQRASLASMAAIRSSVLGWVRSQAGASPVPLPASAPSLRNSDFCGPAPIPADFDSVAVNQQLIQAGYGNFGFLRAEGPRLMLEATNPQGEPVTLELDRQGEVVRETAR